MENMPDILNIISTECSFRNMCNGCFSLTITPVPTNPLETYIHIGVFPVKRCKYTQTTIISFFCPATDNVQINAKKKQ